MKLLILALLLCGCEQTKEQKNAILISKHLTEVCAANGRYETLCELSVGDTTSCYLKRGRRSVAVDCAMYDELVRRVK